MGLALPLNQCRIIMSHSQGKLFNFKSYLYGEFPSAHIETNACLSVGQRSFECEIDRKCQSLYRYI